MPPSLLSPCTSISGSDTPLAGALCGQAEPWPVCDWAPSAHVPHTGLGAAPPLRHGTNLPASASAVNSRLSGAIWQQLSLTSPNPWECRKLHKTRPGEGPRPVVFARVWHPARPPAVPLHRQPQLGPLTGWRVVLELPRKMLPGACLLLLPGQQDIWGHPLPGLGLANRTQPKSHHCRDTPASQAPRGACLCRQWLRASMPIPRGLSGGTASPSAPMPLNSDDSGFPGQLRSEVLQCHTAWP